MVVRCRSNKTEMYIDWKSYMTDEITVTARVGSEAAKRGRWGASSDNQASFAPSVIPLLQSMLEQTSFVAQATPYSENPITAVFDITSMGNAIQPLRETCGW